jgi:hypothetical protein
MQNFIDAETAILGLREDRKKWNDSLQRKMEIETSKLSELKQNLQGAFNKTTVIPDKYHLRQKEYIDRMTLLEWKQHLKRNFVVSGLDWLGAWHYSVLLLGISMLLGIISTTKLMGSDFISGNTYVSITVVSIATLGVDILFLFIIRSLLSGLEYFCRNTPQRYIQILWLLAVVSAFTGFLAFCLLIIERVKEVI